MKCIIHFYHAMLCISTIFAVAWRPSVCHVGALYPHCWRYRPTSLLAW